MFGAVVAVGLTDLSWGWIMCVCDAVFLLGNLGMVGLVEMGGPPLEVDMSKDKAGLTLVLLGCQIFLFFLTQLWLFVILCLLKLVWIVAEEPYDIYCPVNHESHTEAKQVIRSRVKSWICHSGMHHCIFELGWGWGGTTFKWIRSTIGKLYFLVVGKACMAIVWPAPGFQSGKLGGLSRGAHNLCICSCSSLPWTCKWQVAGGGGSWGGSCEVQVVGGSSSRKNNLEQADSVHYPVFDARKWACWLHRNAV